MSDDFKYHAFVKTTGRAFNGGDDTHRMLVIGTADEIADAVRESVLHGLKNNARSIVLEPVHPANVHEIGKRR